MRTISSGDRSTGCPKWGGDPFRDRHGSIRSPALRARRRRVRSAPGVAGWEQSPRPAKGSALRKGKNDRGSAGEEDGMRHHREKGGTHRVWTRPAPNAPNQGRQSVRAVLHQKKNRRRACRPSEEAALLGSGFNFGGRPSDDDRGHKMARPATENVSQVTKQRLSLVGDVTRERKRGAAECEKSRRRRWAGKRADAVSNGVNSDKSDH